MFYQTSMGLIYLIFNQLPFLWDTSAHIYLKKSPFNLLKSCVTSRKAILRTDFSFI